MEEITQNIHHYLKAIYELSACEDPVSTTALASRLGIAPASVTGMLQRLSTATPPLVIYRKYQGVKLTPEGERAALEVIRHHRLLESYLVQKLGFTWDEVHNEASRLEHVISEQLEMRIAAVLGNPQRDPHGELIPTAELTMPGDSSLPLSGLRPPNQATVLRVQPEDPNLLRYLEAEGLLPGAHVDVLEYSPFDQNLRLLVGGRELVLGPAVTSQVFVES